MASEEEITGVELKDRLSAAVECVLEGISDEDWVRIRKGGGGSLSDLNAGCWMPLLKKDGLRAISSKEELMSAIQDTMNDIGRASRSILDVGRMFDLGAVAGGSQPRTVVEMMFVSAITRAIEAEYLFRVALHVNDNDRNVDPKKDEA